MSARSWVPSEDREAFGAWLDACARQEASLATAVSLLAERHAPVREALGALWPSSSPAPSSASSSSASSSSELARALRQGLAGDWSAYEVMLTAAGAALGRAGISSEAYADFAAAAGRLLTREIAETLGSDPRRMSASLQVAQQLLLQSLVLADEARRGVGRVFRSDREKPMARLFESGIMGILICDLVGNIRDANDTFLQLVGYTRPELLSGAVQWAQMTPPEYRHLDEDAVEQLKARGVTRPWEKEYIRKDGSRVPILVGVALLNDTECIAFVLDISERRRVEELRARSAELEAQNRRFQESNRLKSEFLANMSHELRTPLNSIIGFAELLHQGEVAAGSPQHHEFLGDILNSGRHLLQLINDVLDLAKVEAGKFEFRAQPVELSRLIAEVVAVVRSMAASKRIRVEVDAEATVDRVTLDPARLKQVLYNYVSNALKFTHDGGQVWIRTRAEGTDMFRLEVEDTGIGILPGDVGRLFVEFQQLDAGATKRHAGTGLGLALTKRLVEAQGGSVGVRTSWGKGSVFFVTLPLRVDATVSGDDQRTVFPAANSATSPSILIIDDDARDRAVLAQALHRAGYGVETAATGAQGIRASLDRQFEAITLDLLLPDITGLEVLHGIRSAGKNRDTPVVVVSVVAEKGVVGGFAVHDYLPKPINSVELLGSLRRAGVVADNDGCILVVDDDPTARKLMETTLKTLGHRAAGCESGEQALRSSRQARPRAVVLDLLMPEMDGFEFLARFREDPGNRHVPVIVWTLKDLSEDDQRRLSASAQAVVSKQAQGAVALIDELRALLPRHAPAQGVVP